MIFFHIIIIQSVNLDGSWTVLIHTALELNIQPVDPDLRRFVYPTHHPDRTSRTTFEKPISSRPSLFGREILTPF